MHQVTNITWPNNVTAIFPAGSLPDRVSSLVPDNQAWQHSEGRPSAVLLLFSPCMHKPGAAEVVLTRRSTSVRTHKGQIGFVGGRREAKDITPKDTAIREAFEELAIPSSHITTVGMLPALRGIDKHEILPILAVTDLSISQFRTDPSEVAEVFTVPWTTLTKDYRQSFRFNLFGKWRVSDLYPTPKGSIWGITAHIIKTADLAHLSD